MNRWITVLVLFSLVAMSFALPVEQELQDDARGDGEIEAEIEVSGDKAIFLQEAEKGAKMYKSHSPHRHHSHNPHRHNPHRHNPHRHHRHHHHTQPPTPAPSQVGDTWAPTRTPTAAPTPTPVLPGTTWYCAIRHDGRGNSCRACKNKEYKFNKINILKRTYSLSEAQTVLTGKLHWQAIIPMTGSKAGDPHTLPRTWSGGSMHWSGWGEINAMRAKCATLCPSGQCPRPEGYRPSTPTPTTPTRTPTRKRSWRKMPTKCWRKMPTGCARALSEPGSKGTGLSWFIDPQSHDSATCTARTADYNIHCGKSDALTSWGSTVVVTIGRSRGRTTKTVGPPPRGYICPSVVSKANWVGRDTHPDTFKITQSGTELSARRTDHPGHGWGMNLEIMCASNIKESSKCWRKMPTGCARDLSGETSSPRNWFIDPHSPTKAICGARATIYNWHCGKSDALTQWVVKP